MQARAARACGSCGGGASKRTRSSSRAAASHALVALARRKQRAGALGAAGGSHPPVMPSLYSLFMRRSVSRIDACALRKPASCGGRTQRAWLSSGTAWPAAVADVPRQGRASGAHSCNSFSSGQRAGALLRAEQAEETAAAEARQLLHHGASELRLVIEVAGQLHTTRRARRGEIMAQARDRRRAPCAWGCMSALRARSHPLQTRYLIVQTLNLAVKVLPPRHVDAHLQLARLLAEQCRAIRKVVAPPIRHGAN